MSGKIREFLMDRPVLVAAADGFVWSHLVEALPECGNVLEEVKRHYQFEAEGGPRVTLKAA